MEVLIFIATNNNKVCRIAVADKNKTDAQSIKIRFNTLCRQFENNNKYMSLNDYVIPDDEDIRYEILVNKKRYEAIFYQKPEEFISVNEYIDCLNKKSVWFMISEMYGKYYIAMFYDNEYNRAQGEDL